MLMLMVALSVWWVVGVISVVVVLLVLSWLVPSFRFLMIVVLVLSVLGMMVLVRVLSSVVVLLVLVFGIGRVIVVVEFGAVVEINIVSAVGCAVGNYVRLQCW